jgi:hypothetical protein
MDLIYMTDATSYHTIRSPHYMAYEDKKFKENGESLILLKIGNVLSWLLNNYRLLLLFIILFSFISTKI